MKASTTLGIRQKGWRIALSAALAAGIAFGLGGLGPVASNASSHREAPLTAADPQIDGTDLYAFVSPDNAKTVTLISNWIPFEGSDAGPNFYTFAPGVRYDINIDNNGDAKPDVIYRWVFRDTYKNPKTFLYNTGPVNSLTDATLNYAQHYTLTEIRGNRAHALVADGIVAPSNVGAASMPNYGSLWSQAILPIEGGGKTFAGPADDPFFLDLRVFDLLYGANLKEVGNDSLKGFNIHALAIQVPTSDLAAGDDAGKNPIIGVWTTAERKSVRVENGADKTSANGTYVQVSRLGMPLVNEVVVPVGFKDYFNGSQPKDDAQFLSAVTDPELPHLINKVYGLPVPATPRNDLVSVFLTGVKGLNMPANGKPSEVLRLNMSIPPAASPNRLGVLAGDNAGFPNGRRLTDDIIDVSLRVVEGALTGSKNTLGDGVDANEVPFQTSFPYMALPHAGPAASQVAATTKVKKVTSAGAWPVATGIAIAVAFMALLGVGMRRKGPGSSGKSNMRSAA
jgi:hypothetical protein